MASRDINLSINRRTAERWMRESKEKVSMTTILEVGAVTFVKLRDALEQEA